MAEGDFTDLFARARASDIQAVAGVKLFRAGRRMRGECPLCGGGKGKKAGGSFSCEPTIGRWNCFGCGAKGDVIDLERALGGGTLLQAAERLAGALSSGPRSSRVRAPDPTRPVDAATTPAERIGREIWAQADRAILGTPVATYLRERAIPPRRIEALAQGWLRYHPAAKWGWDEDRGEWLCAPAMVGRLTYLDGVRRGYHVTYLRADGRGKAALDPAKRMWGPQKDPQGRPGGLWLTHPLDDGPLIVAEGIESALSAAELHGGPCRIVATLSLGALQGVLLTDRFGRIDPAAPSADPETPAFVWDDPTGYPWGEVLVAVDRDMKPVRAKARKLGGGTVEVRLDGETRARICAGLAVAAWKAACPAAEVHAIAPAAGRDFNDELMARGGA